MENNGVISDSSPESNADNSAQDPTKNLKAEFNRKLSKLDEKLSKLVNFVERSGQSSPVEETDEDVSDSKRLKNEIKAEAAREIHDQHFQDAKRVFPELDPESDSHDSKFYNEVDRVYTKLLRADPTDKDALKEAVEIVANRTGRYEQLVQNKFLKDEARRSRIIAEGSSAPRDAKKEKETAMNESMLQRMGINPDKLKARIKSNKDKYGAK